MLLGLGNGGGERAFEMFGIRIGKEEPLALRRCASPATRGVGLAGPSLGQRLRRVEDMDITRN